MKKLQAPLTDDAMRDLRAGEEVLLSGVVYTARDAAHQRLTKALDEGAPLPLELRGQVIYYCGPAPTPPGWRRSTLPRCAGVSGSITSAALASGPTPG